MFGTVLAIVNTSACSAVPRAAASMALRTNPLSRETTVPAAITALEDSTLASVRAGPVSLTTRPRWCADHSGSTDVAGSGAATGSRSRRAAGRHPRP